MAKGGVACFLDVWRRSEHVPSCAAIFKVLNIEHVTNFFFHVHKKDFMFSHVESCSSCLGLFKACSQIVNMQKQAKRQYFS